MMIYAYEYDWSRSIGRYLPLLPLKVPVIGPLGGENDLD